MDGEKRVLNVLIAGHAQAGKSSLIEAIVGIFPDYLSFEITRGTTITLKVIQFQLPAKNILLNFLDSPGHADFKGGIALGLEFADLLILVVSGKEGFQARTYWLFEKAIEKRIPIIIAATKMDLPQASIEKIASHIKTVSLKPISIVPTSAKNKMGMEDLVKKITLYMKKRDKIDLDPSFIILGFKYQKGLGVLINAGLLSGKIKRGWLTIEIKVRQIFSMNNSPILEAKEGDIVYLLLNIEKKFPLGT
ncbi:MAG: GTP-binding protein, partial [Promethearchaeota archaeon]